MCYYMKICKDMFYLSGETAMALNVAEQIAKL